MNWKPPHTEEEWLHALSAYIDGELPREDREALERFLETDLSRKRQLIALKKTSGLLQEWLVEAPEPQTEFIRRFNSALDSTLPVKRWTIRAWFPIVRWEFQAGNFVAGLVAGVAGMLLVQTNLFSPKPVFNPAINGQPTFVSIQISPTQAKSLLQEAAAEGLVAQFKQQMRIRNWENAADTYDLLFQTYSDTAAVRELEKSRTFNTFVKKYRGEGEI
ncbi:MAG: hypothetical protein C4527_24190 [Candidatus Omnitrophota bacterium]|jgi:anti-sigma factor RsiW|nr:MAG: hypothetical protein C4527_24190 [Candidatus Omnitrophota bacterium]